MKYRIVVVSEEPVKLDMFPTSFHSYHTMHGAVMLARPAADKLRGKATVRIEPVTEVV